MGYAAIGQASTVASCGIAVMAKASSPGRTKTRLVPPLTFDEAAAFNTAFLKDVATNLLVASRHESISGYIAYGPPGRDSLAFFNQTLPAGIGLLEAWHPNFGACLSSAIDQMFAREHRGAVVLNSDSPTLPTALLVKTAALLAQPGDHAVLGPSTDGGYYLLGVKRRHDRLFEDIDWSTEQVSRQTMQRAQEIGLRLYVLPTWYDVDDIDSLRRLHAELFAGAVVSDDLRIHDAPHTAKLMRALTAEGDFATRFGSIPGRDLRRVAG